MDARKKQRRAEQKPAVAASASSLDPRLRNILAGFALCIITLLAYSNSFEAGFTFDNRPIILGAPQIQEATGHNVGLILQHSYWWPQFDVGLYRPFTTLSYLLNYAVLGNRDQPAGYHWINLLLHAGNVILAYLLALRLMREYWLAVLTASLWAVHPVLTEAVTNIIGRADLLAALAILSGLLLYLKAAESSGPRRILRLAGLAAVTMVGVFSKESAVAVLGVIVLYELTWWKERRQHLALAWGCLAVLVPLAAMLYQRAKVLAHSQVAAFPFIDNPLVGAGFWQARLTAIKVVARYFFITIWPAKLSSDYSYSEIPLSTGTLADWISWIVVGALIAGVVLLYRRNRTAFFFAGFAAITFAPGSNLLFNSGTIMAERLIYLSCLGVLACLVLAIHAVAQRVRKPVLLPIAVGLIVAAFLIRTWERNADWQSDLTLFKSAAEASSGSYKAHHLYARWAFNADAGLARQNQVTSAASLANLDLVIAEAEKSIAILDTVPDSLNTPDPYLSAGEYYVIKGDYLQSRAGSEAAAAYRRGLQIALRAVPLADAERKARRLRENASGDLPAPQFTDAEKDPEAYELLALLYLRTGDFEKAIETGGLARALAPLSPEVHHQMAEALRSAGRQGESATALAEGIIITANQGLKQELADFYRKDDPKGCELTQASNRFQINPSCEAVRKNFCAAAPDALKAMVQIGRRDLAAAQKKNLLQDYHCPPGPLEELLPDKAGY